MRSLVRVALLAALLSTFAWAGGALAHSGARTRIRFELTGPAIDGVIPGGRVEFESKDSESRLSVKVRHVNLPDATLDVFVDSTLAGQIALNEEGNGALKLRSKKGDTVPPLTSSSTVTVKDHATGITALSGPPTRPRKFEMRTDLAGSELGGETPKGKARYREDEFGNRRRLKIEIQDVNLAGGSLDIFADGTLVGALSITGLGETEFELDTKDGDTVPTLTTTSVLELKNQADGSTVLVSGTWKVKGSGRSSGR